MVPITTFHYLLVAAILFLLGVMGVLMRRNVIIVLMSIELILSAVSLNLVAFSRMWGNLHGQVFALFITVDAVAQTAAGLGILIAFFQNRESGQG
jgi:NADH-quinone oxidoreductase subunit K